MTEGKQIYYHRLRENSRKMNPRLKELAVEAGAYLDNGAILHGPMVVAKFAELIVQECAKEAFEFWCNQVDCNEESARPHIKKYFGVE